MATVEGRVLVGRDAELDVIDEFVELDWSGPRALVLTGGPGVGKTALWEHGLERARDCEIRALVARPSEAESQLGLAALADLLEGVDDAVLAALPGPQAHALEVVLLRQDGGERPPEPRAIAAAFLHVLRLLSAETEVMIAVDDTHWLDAASDGVLRFCSRRLAGERVGFLLSQRVETTSALVQSLDRSRTRRVELDGLSFGAIRELLAAELQLDMPRRTVRKLYESSQGNPLFALEIGRVLAERGAESASGDPLPVPDDVQTLVRERIESLPELTRELLLAAALLARPDAERIGATLAVAVNDTLAPAQRAGIASLRGEMVVFAHPLHAAGVVAVVTDAERRNMHRRLADSATNLEQRARHLAQAGGGNDEGTAQALEEGAAVARARGALHEAADLLERAGELTPLDEPDTAQRRWIDAADLYLHAGDPEHARTLLERVLSEPLHSRRRAEALRLLAEICIGEDSRSEAERLLLDALGSATEDRSRARIDVELAYVSISLYDYEGAAAYARRALELLATVDDEPLLAEALAYCAICDFFAGLGADWWKVERALRLEDPDRISLPGLPPSGIGALLMMYVGRHTEARELMGSVCTRLAERGAEKDLPHALLWTSWLETRAGNFAVAAATADEAVDCASVAGNELIAKWATAQRAWVDAHVGRQEDAQRRIAQGLGEGEPNGDVSLWAVTTLALLGAAVPDYGAVWEACEPLVEAVEARGIGEPVPHMFLPDAIEALIGLDQLDRAETLLAQFEQRARELDRTWALATSSRCRGLLHAWRGDADSAVESLQDALRTHERIDLPFDRARTLLVLATVQRRSRKRREARASAEAAAAEFERIGAEGWAERARAELRRISGRKVGDDGALTPSERRVVELAVQGLSNKEIAARLVVSVHTVEVHLSHAYRKLGVRSRTQLAAVTRELKV